jgi:hypothetical protein
MEFDVLSQEMGSGFLELLGDVKYTPSDNQTGLLLDEAIARIELPNDPRKIDQEQAIQRVASLVFELTLKMENEAAQLRPNLVIASEAPQKASKAAKLFLRRAFERHPLYEPYLGKRCPDGNRYRIALNLIYATAPVPIKGVEKTCFVYSVSSSVWTETTGWFNSIFDRLGFSTAKGKREDRIFKKYLERYHTGSAELKEED